MLLRKFIIILLAYILNNTLKDITMNNHYYNSNNLGIDKESIIYNKNKDIYMEVDGKTVYAIANSIQDRISFQNKWGIFKKDLNDDEYNFIKLYTFEGYIILNCYFRKLSAIQNSKKESLKNKCDEEWSKFKHYYDYVSFDKALIISNNIAGKGKSLDEDLIVFRRQTIPLSSFAEDGIYHGDSFLSTSIYEPDDIFGDFLEYIFIPKGKKILYISDISSNSNENELLLARNFDLKMIEQKSDYITHWKMI